MMTELELLQVEELESRLEMAEWTLVAGSESKTTQDSHGIRNESQVYIGVRMTI